MRIVPYIGFSSYLLDIQSLKGGLIFNEVGIQMVAVENIIIFHMEIKIQRPHQHGKKKKNRTGDLNSCTPTHTPCP